MKTVIEILLVGDNPGMDKWAPQEYVEAFFENPSDPTKYDPKSH